MASRKATRKSYRKKVPCGGRRTRKQAGGASKWLSHVKKTYAMLKKKSKTASLGDAMKAAKKTYK